jgi:hypothetical protein
VALRVGVAGSFVFEVVGQGEPAVQAEEHEHGVLGLLDPPKFGWGVGLDLVQGQADQFGATEAGAPAVARPGSVPALPGVPVRDRRLTAIQYSIVSASPAGTPRPPTACRETNSRGSSTVSAEEPLIDVSVSLHGSGCFLKRFPQG